MPKSTGTPYTLYDLGQPLSSVYIKRADKELGEKPEQISANLESFKRWLNSMPHLTINVNDTFLVAFLRQAKYNHMKAQNRLDNFCTFRTSSVEGCPAWFENFEARKADFDKWVEMKCWVPLGFTQDDKLDLNQISVSDLQGACQIWHDQCIMDQRDQVGGFCMIMDLTDFRKEDIIKLFDPKISRLITKYLQEWNLADAESVVMMIGTNMNLAFDAVPGLKDIMPESYGGNVKLSFEELCDRMTDTLKSIPDYEAKWAISVDESKRPKENKNLFGNYKDLSEDLMGKSGAYVKLNDEI
ncbi:hypothetical protein ACTXT7_000208 [Hymenolepis weldensis]